MGDAELRTWHRMLSDVESYLRRQCLMCPTPQLKRLVGLLGAQQTRRTLPKSDMRRIALEQAETVLANRDGERVEVYQG